MIGDWIEHNGGQCPEEVSVAAESKKQIVLRFRNGCVAYVNRKPSLYTWEHSGHPGDIVAYRIDIVAYRIESAVEPKQELQAAKPVRPLGPILEGWRALELDDIVEEFDVIWDADKRKGVRVSMWGYPFKNDNGTGLVIIRQLATSYHRGCGSINVGVDR